jgi:hypothetical protein
MDTEQVQQLAQAVDGCLDSIVLFAGEQDNYAISYANSATALLV